MKKLVITRKTDTQVNNMFAATVLNYADAGDLVWSIRTSAFPNTLLQEGVETSPRLDVNIYPGEQLDVWDTQGQHLLSGNY